MWFQHVFLVHLEFTDSEMQNSRVYSAHDLL